MSYVCKNIRLGIFFVLLASACKTRTLNEKSGVKNAAEEIRKLNIAEYKKEVPVSEIESVQRVANAVVAIADYSLLRNDFPELKNLNNDAIDSFLVNNYAFFSKPHIDFTIKESGYSINTKIPLESAVKNALRPPFYGRALMIPSNTGLQKPSVNGGVFVSNSTENGILVDVKGAGNPEPELVEDFHGNGQAYFGEAMREFHFQKLIQLIFDKEGKGWKTNPVYAAIILPFSAEHEFSTKLRSALIIRKAAFRHGKFTNHGGFVFYSQNKKLNEQALNESLERELALRKYGITSAIELNLGEQKTVDAVNLQYTREQTLIDFGSFGVVQRFSNVLEFCNPQFKGDVNKSPEPLRHTGFNIGDCAYSLKPEDGRFLKTPSANLVVSKNLWGLGQITEAAVKLIPEKHRPKVRTQFLDNPSLAGTWLASEFDKGASQGKQEAFLQHCRFMLPVIEKVGVNKSLVPTIADCPDVSIVDAEIQIQLQATLALKGIVNADNLEQIVETSFKQFEPAKILETVKTAQKIGENLFKQWENFLND